MISEVQFSGTTYNDTPYRFEAGTPHIEGVLGLATAIQYVQKIGWDWIESYEKFLLTETISALKSIPGIRFIGQADHRGPIVSFVVDGTHPSDLGQLLDQQNIAVRVGHHCTQPLMRRFHVSGTVRVSLSIYNQVSEIQSLTQALLKAKDMLT